MSGAMEWLERARAALSKAFRAPSRLGFDLPGPSSEALSERIAGSSLNFVLAPLKDEDAPALRALTDNPAITDAISFLKSPFTLDDAMGLIRANGAPEDCFLGVRRRADRALIAVIGAHLRGESTVEVGYWVGAAYQRQGYATEALGALIAKIADAMPGRQIIAECRPENRASVRVLEKLGFQTTGASGVRPGREVFALRLGAAGS
jgi:RimJ/RimL family protein N-acetyltransferase